MAYGLRVNNSNGDTIYDTSSIAWFQVAQFEAAAKPATGPGIPNNETVVRWDEVGLGFLADTDSGGKLLFETLIQIQMIDVPPNDQEGYSPQARVNQFTAKVDQFGNTNIGFQATERVVAIVLARNSL